MPARTRWRAKDRFIGVVFGLSVTCLTRSPTAQPLHVFDASGFWWPRIGLASWYSEQDPGIHPSTANGELFHDGALTAAIWDLPFGSCVEVTNLRTLRHVAVRINDRGPHPRLVAQGRVIDLSRSAFEQLGDLQEGLMPVQLELADSHRCMNPTPQMAVARSPEGIGEVFAQGQPLSPQVPDEASPSVEQD